MRIATFTDDDGVSCLHLREDRGDGLGEKVAGIWIKDPHPFEAVGATWLIDALAAGGLEGQATARTLLYRLTEHERRALSLAFTERRFREDHQ